MNFLFSPVQEACHRQGLIGYWFWYWRLPVKITTEKTPRLFRLQKSSVLSGRFQGWFYDCWQFASTNIHSHHRLTRLRWIWEESWEDTQCSLPGCALFRVRRTAAKTSFQQTQGHSRLSVIRQATAYVELSRAHKKRSHKPSSAHLLDILHTPRPAASPLRCFDGPSLQAIQLVEAPEEPIRHSFFLRRRPRRGPFPWCRRRPHQRIPSPRQRHGRRRP